MNHSFHLVSLKDFGYEEYFKGVDRDGGVVIYHDHLRYLADTLIWIETCDPFKQKPHRGLFWFGPTVIRTEGAAAVRVFQAWADLFKAGPEILILLDHDYTFDEAHQMNFHPRLKVPRDDFVSKLSTLAAYAQQVIDSRGEFYILHLGI
ncbi:MAG TPA: hypothetical protein PKD09_17680 [Aggregatilinea sp.]|uniref:hypothetical protein n=1 Tax=Aggregatilinea sp. TaxID=2806333 RepID=UPI002B590B62|nr:hypothetical protein [Aggregatilinea sp.]HML23491.1 hypothetical protein [Aggregatilinea sp.]